MNASPSVQNDGLHRHGPEHVVPISGSIAFELPQGMKHVDVAE